MASNKKTIVLGLDYSQFDGGITEVNRKMSLLDQEFKFAAESSKRFGSETETLTLKQEYLTQKINLQNIKLEEAKKKYDAVMSSNTANSKAIDNADKALLKERLTLEKLNNELAENKEKLNKLAISEVDKKIAILEQEFALAAERSKQLGDETQELAVKSDMLTEKIALQTEKVKLSKKAYEDAKNAGELSEDKLKDLYKAYLQNETALEKLNNELKENNNKLDEAGRGFESFGDFIRNTASMIGLEVSPAIEGLASKFDGVSKEVGTAVLTIGTVITTLGSLTFSTTKAAGEIDELSHKTGLSTDTIQELNYAAEYLEISAEDIGSSIAKMTRNMDSARKGTGDAAEAFKKLHVRITESNGQLRDSEEVFYDTIDALGKVRNETEKDALSMAIFGRSAMSLNNLILEGSDGIKEYARQAHEAGYVLDNDTINSLNAFDDTMVELNKKFEAVKMTLGTALLPVLQTFADLISSIPTPVLTGIVVFGTLSAVIISLTKAIGSAAVVWGALSTANVALGATGTMATAGMAPLLPILLGIAAAIALITGGAMAIKAAMQDATEASQKVIDGANNLPDTVAKARQSTVRSIGYANGTKYAVNEEVWVGENGPERVKLPTGSRVYSAEESKNMGNTYINIDKIELSASDVDEIQKVITVFDRLKQQSRQGKLKRG